MRNPTASTAPEAPRRTGPSFATRLLVAQALVLVAGALTSWLVASAVGPRIFSDHLRRAEVPHTSTEAGHVEEAFGTALLISLWVALVASVLMALVVTWYFTRRLYRSIAAVTDSASEIAAGHYGSRLPSPGLGEEFDNLAGTFNELAQRLDAVESTRRRMLADLAHEMRTPLATLDAHFEALEDGVRELDAATLSVLRSSTSRLGRLAEDIKAVSLAQEGRIEIRLESASPSELTDRAVREARDRYHAKGVELIEAVTTDVSVRVDPDRIGQALGNLLDNALRHTPPGGTVTLGCHAAGRWVDFVVRDSGEGVAPEHLSQVFDRFYRADASRSRAQGGSGIGLTITKALVDAHGGRISVESPGIGQGATFTVRLPATARQP